MATFAGSGDAAPWTASRAASRTASQSRPSTSTSTGATSTATAAAAATASEALGRCFPISIFFHLLTKLDAPIFQFKGMNDFLARIASVKQGPTPESLTPDCVEFRDVSPENSDEIKKKAGQEGQAVGRFFYLADTRLLIITLATDPHEELHRFIYRHIDRQAVTMGLPDELRSVGERKAPGQGKSSGESDSNFFPTSQRSRQDWPSFVIEAGYSQSDNLAREKARWWLRESNYTVNLVLVVRMNLSQRTIWIEKWKGMQPPVYTGPAARSRTALPGPPPPLAPGRDGNRIVITRLPGITDIHPARFNPASYQVARGNLQIDFEDLFDRAAQPPLEADIILNAACLQRFAVSCWKGVHD